MKCPLFSIVGVIAASPGEEIYQDCLKEECAWYHDGLKDCGLFLIQEYLALITAQLVELVNKMPHAGQFLK